jgi:transcriptional regulator with GAF, ATPase, and Fis domain
MMDIKKNNSDTDPIAEKREEKALRNFKKVLNEILYMLMRSTGSETASLQWVNNQREQFVLENYCSLLSNTTFQDRTDYKNSFLYPFRDVTEIVTLEVGVDVQPEELTHYYKTIPIKFLYVIPFINNGETVGLTILESNQPDLATLEIDSIRSYITALGNLLYTFIELSELSKDEAQWYQYDEMLEQVNSKDDHAQLIDNISSQLESFLNRGGVTFLSRTAGGWRVLLNSAYSRNAPRIGTILQENSMANEALKTGTSQFSIHFNNSPHRVSRQEPICSGATLAIPLIMQDRRQGVFIINDENPLLFKESVKHKLTNLIRILGLKMATSKESYRVETDFLTHETGSLSMPIIERIISREITRSSSFPNMFTWVVIYTFDEINTIRTRYGVGVLKALQKQIIRRTTVDHKEFSNVTGFHADYIYIGVIQSGNENGKDLWIDYIQNESSRGYQCEKDTVDLSFTFGSILVNQTSDNVDHLLQQVKKEFSMATKSTKLRTR